MRKELRVKLDETIKEIETKFSQPSEKYQTTQELKFEKGYLLSELVAALEFKRGNRKNLVLAYHNGNNESKWQYFFIKESHAFAFGKVENIFREVEQFNFTNTKVEQPKKENNIPEFVDIDVDNLPF